MTKPAADRVSRRNLLGGIAVGVAALGAVAVPALNRTWFARDGRGAGNWWKRQYSSLDRAGLNEWTKQIGSHFTVAGEGGNASFKLVGVEPLPSKGARPQDVSRDRAFMAVFESAEAAPEGDRIYPVNHDTYGDMKIYFSATAPAATGHRLQAVFN